MTGQEIVSALTSSALVVYLIQWMKTSKAFAWVNAESTNVNRTLGALGALIGAFGVHFTYEGGTLTITGLTLAALGHGVWHWVNEWAAQQVIYDAITNKTANVKHTIVTGL